MKTDRMKMPAQDFQFHTFGEDIGWIKISCNFLNPDDPFLNQILHVEVLQLNLSSFP